MPDRLSMHGPILVNTLGHCAGAVAFGILLFLLVLDWRHDRQEKSVLPSIAAGLALLWNIGSLIGIATAPGGDALTDGIVAASFSVLSLLPAVLLHISVAPRHLALWITGYVISGLAVALHIVDVITALPRFHYAALLLVTIGFGSLATLAVLLEAFSEQKDGSGTRIAGTMVLFLFAMSFVHFGSGHDTKAWSSEAAFHHAGIPLALFVLLQDYRFLLLDAFIRFLVNALLAVLMAWTAFRVETRFNVIEAAMHDPFYAGLAFTLFCLALTAFAWARNAAQRLLTGSVFFRPSLDSIIFQLREIATTVPTEPEYLAQASRAIAAFLSSRRFEVIAETESNSAGLRKEANAVMDRARWGVASWVRAFAPLQFSRGDARLLLLGMRAGGRPYLSEDIRILNRIAAIVSEQVERIRSGEMQSLVSQAELRALQAQINPHFLFNALNTLYGTIARENSEARKLVLNLADLFRYSFTPNRGLIRIEEELTIVRAYLEIEHLRLGDKLLTEIDIDDSALGAQVPVLSIQPLVENAVKHGAAFHSGAGFVLLRIQKFGERITVDISNSGSFREPAPDHSSSGVGLSNVRRRLSLCYGTESELEISSVDNVTNVRFSLPSGLPISTAN